MSARQETNSDHFDLLPFIAILMCTLGCLLLVTMSIAAISVGPSKTMGWIPVFDKTSQHPKPVLVEWDGTTVVIHMPDTPLPIKAPFDGEASMKTDTPVIGPELQKFIDWMAAHKNANYYAIIAVRPSGFATFIGLREVFRKNDIHIGYEPAEQSRNITLLPGEVR